MYKESTVFLWSLKILKNHKGPVWLLKGHLFRNSFAWHYVFFCILPNKIWILFVETLNGWTVRICRNLHYMKAGAEAILGTWGQKMYHKVVKKKIRPFNYADSWKRPGSETNTSRKFNPNVPHNYHHSAKSHEYWKILSIFTLKKKIFFAICRVALLFVII